MSSLPPSQTAFIMMLVTFGLMWFARYGPDKVESLKTKLRAVIPI